MSELLARIEELRHDIYVLLEAPELYVPEVLVRQQEEHFAARVRAAKAQGDRAALKTCCEELEHVLMRLVAFRRAALGEPPGRSDQLES